MSKRTIVAAQGCIIDRVPFRQGAKLGELDADGKIVNVAEGITRGHVEAKLNTKLARALEPGESLGGVGEATAAGRAAELGKQTVPTLRQIAADHSIDLPEKAIKAQIVDAILTAEGHETAPPAE